MICPPGELIRSANNVRSILFNSNSYIAVVILSCLVFSFLLTNYEKPDFMSGKLHYITQRNAKTEISLKSLLYRNRIPNFDIETFWSIKTKPIQIALAISGGGYRSMLTGAGVILALDDRYPNSSLCLNGLLQSTSYIAGISGGSWLVMVILLMILNLFINYKI